MTQVVVQSTKRRGTQARGRATRERLLSAARRLFCLQGYDGTSMADIAREAGVGVGTLYHHLLDKRAVLLELVDRWGDKEAQQRRTDLDHEAFLGDDPRAAIFQRVLGIYRRLRDEPSLYLVVLGLAERDEEVRRRYGRIEQFAIERLAALIEFGQRRGQFREGLDPRAAAFLIHHSVDMAATQLLVRGQPADDPDRVLTELSEMICRYVLKE